MENKIYYQELECYSKATQKQLRALNNAQYFDLDQLPTDGLKKEFAAYIRERGRNVGIITIKGERNYFNRLCRFLQRNSNHVESLRERPEELWLRQLRGWMMTNGYALSKKKINIYGNTGIENAGIVRYFKNLLVFINLSDGQREIEKDIWKLSNLNIETKNNPIRNVQTLNFQKILQPDIREEVKKAIFLHLKYESIQTIVRELTVMRKFSKYLCDKCHGIQSCGEIDRKLIEEYLIYINVEIKSGHGKRDDILKLRNVLESIGKLYGYSNLETLFLNSDFPKQSMAEFKVYSDAELKRLNAHITKMEEQITRCLIIHQMLGCRISDTLTLQQDCLYKMGSQDMITIHQVKTRMFEKPISGELAQLIRKAIDYTQERYGERKYIFVDADNPDRPLQYNTIQNKVIRMILQENLRDDQGELFGFNTHMFRHYYGVKLTEMHLDDWTIAKLLGHKNVKSVKYYRKMSNQTMADETRKVRQMMSDIIMANLDGWGEEYEQIRQDAGRK